MSGNFTWFDLSILIVYLILVLFAGLFLSKTDMKGLEFFKGDGSIPWFVTSVSVFATLLSPISFMSLPGNSYAGSWILWFAQLGMIVAIPLTINFFLPIYARLDIDTAYDYLEKRFDSRGLRIISAVIFIVYQIGRMSIIIYLPSMALAGLTGIHVGILILLMGVIAILYSSTGGIKSVIWTDFIQGTVLLVSVTVGLIFLIGHINGGLGAIGEAFQNGKFIASDEQLFDPNLLNISVFMVLIGGGLNTFSQYISGQDIVQRFTTTTNPKKLTKMMLSNGFISLFIATVFFLIGTGLFVYYQVQNPNDPGSRVPQDLVFTYFTADLLPAGMAGVIMAAIYAAAQSTLSTGLNSVATSWTLDIQNKLFTKKKLTDKQLTSIARVVTILVGIFAIIVAFVMVYADITSAYEWFNEFVGTVLGILAGIFVLGVFTKKANKYGAYAALLVTTLIMIYITYFVPEDAITIWTYALLSIVVAVIVGYIVSLFTKGKKAPENTTVYDIKKILSNTDWIERD